MKKLLAVAAAGALALALVGCAASSPASSASSESMEASDVSSSASSESASSSAESKAMLTWTEAKDAKTAAEKAGLDGFATPADTTEISIGKLSDANWTFLYTDGMAEADGGVGAAAAVLRKSKTAGDNTAEPSDYTKDWTELQGMTYANEWEMTINDVDVRCYGNEKGKASKMVWDQDGHGYSLLIIGQGDEWTKFGIDQDDVSILVGATIKANADYNAKSEEASKSSAAAKSSEAAAPAASSEAAESNDDANEDAFVNNVVWENGLGELQWWDKVDYGDSWAYEVVTTGADGNTYTSYIDGNGNVLENGYDIAQENQSTVDEGAIDEFVNDAVWQNGLGELVDYERVEYSEGGLDFAYKVTTRGSDGNEYVTYIDEVGNVVGTE